MKNKMKNKLSNIILPWVTLLLMTACKNPKIGYESFTITNETIKAEVYSIKVTGTFSFAGNVEEMNINISTDESLDNPVVYSLYLDGNNYSSEIDGLDPNTTYYYCYSIDFGWKEDYLTEPNSFSTQLGPPLVRTLEVTAIDESTYRVKCEVSSDGGTPISERGICWNTSGEPNENDNIVKHNENNLGEYVCQMNHLEPNTTYYVRAYAKNSIGFGLGEEVLIFNTPNHDPLTITVQSNPPSGGSTTGGGVFSYGESCTVHAEAAENYTFINWTENDLPVSTETDYSFAVYADHILVANFLENDKYRISAEVTPNNGGTVSGTGNFFEGDACTLVALPSQGYEFEKWTKNEVLVSTNASFSFTVTETATYVAHFKLQNYTITATADPTNGGTINGGGTFNYGDHVTLTATPATGYSFENWTKDGQQVSTQASYSFDVTESATYIAHFQIQYYTITLSTNISNGGTVTGGGSYPYGQTCSIQAVANSNYFFENWTENGTVITTNAEYTITVTGNQTFEAHFAEQSPSGAIDGLFSISSNNRVYFSKGNLYYMGSASSPYWKFADQQWNRLGNTGQGSTSQTVNRDLFGWGTSGLNHGAVCYQPWSTSSNNSDYYAYGSPNNNLGGGTGKADWGYNSISNSGTAARKWRTLTQEEWNYVLNERAAATLNGTPNARYAKATVNNVAGIILFPDSYSHPSGVAVPTNINVPSTLFTVNNYSGYSWTSMETNGCVFLPVAGSRYGTNVVTPDAKGYYWSSSYSNDSHAYSLYFGDNSINAEYRSGRSTGQSVRLVYPIE